MPRFCAASRSFSRRRRRPGAGRRPFSADPSKAGVIRVIRLRERENLWVVPTCRRAAGVGQKYDLRLKPLGGRGQSSRAPRRAAASMSPLIDTLSFSTPARKTRQRAGFVALGS